MVEYLKTDPLFERRFSNVWLWTDWPDHEGPDVGIDLVAEERDGSGLCAIQCKFYAPDHTLAKADIDSFFTASGKEGFTSRLIISTTDKWSKHAEAALTDQIVPVSRIGIEALASSSIDWAHVHPQLAQVPTIPVQPKHALRPHQAAALEDVFEGFTIGDRGQLIMACGTGKTFTALKIAEQVVADKSPEHAQILFLVPSISLMSQTVREWANQAQHDLRFFAVCSDTKVGKSEEDISVHDLAIPATTDPVKIATAARKTTDAAATVVFATYQSIEKVAAAQHEDGLGDFDLIICDEAHRTTGVTLAGEDESPFVRVHDQEFIRGDRRLYMTATPRIFNETAKSKAEEQGHAPIDMNDHDMFGHEFHRLGFGEAVDRDLLTDYKVLILTVDEEYVAERMQAQFADENNELTLGDAVKIVGCWNGLAKRQNSTEDTGFGPDAEPMRRAVAFAGSIKASKQIQTQFQEVVDTYTAEHPDALPVKVHHVDGTQNAQYRDNELSWLREGSDSDCRILSNARCLSEGVDVPNLDAVLFLNPRNSVVDVVQSVGRVMRKAPGKDYGYVILPIGIPAGMPPEEALADHQKYKVIWQVLQALRAHDDRFNATVNKIELNKQKPDNILIGKVGPDSDGDGGELVDGTQQVLSFPVEDWRDAIYAKIVTKVGEKTYWEDWAKDVAQIAEAHETRIRALINDPNSDKTKAFQKFREQLQAIINPTISTDDAIGMLAQHLITQPVFDALFSDYDFSANNPVSQAMQGMLTALDDQQLSAENQQLEGFYRSVKKRAEGIDNAEARQAIIKELYERFFKLALPKTADALGIVYTPIPVVDFMLRATNQALQKHLHTDLSGEGVQILDPFTGTGTFVARLINSGLIKPVDLERKYSHELHANEILLLAYYIAAVNIEAAYHEQHPGTYEPFNGIVLTDTFQLAENPDSLDAELFPTNSERVNRQKALDIRVILGNPPYSVGQTSANDANANLKYAALDTRIEETYAARSTAVNKNSLYDSYIRAIRWASDRIGDDGIICYVSNGGYIDGNTADGLRLTLADEFSHIYCYNLRGNARTSGEQRQKEKGNVFGSGSRATAAILILVKQPGHVGSATIHYCDIGDYLNRDQKLATIATADLRSINWQTITPNPQGDWINQRDPNYATYTPLAAKTKKGQAQSDTIFTISSRGLETTRDAWVYNCDQVALEANVRRTITAYNDTVNQLTELRTTDPDAGPDDVIDYDPTRFSWSSSAKQALARRQHFHLDPSSFRTGTYRPFCKQHVCFNPQLNHRQGKLPALYPTAYSQNHGFLLNVGGTTAPFCGLMIDALPDLNYFGQGGQFFARYRYEEAPEPPKSSSRYGSGQGDMHAEEDPSDQYQRIDNITDSALADYQATYGPAITKDDIFYYVYGLLHSPDYRDRYAANLKKMLPRIPQVQAADFHTFTQAGRDLADLHTNYETIERYELGEEIRPDLHLSDDELYRMQKMRWASKADKTRLIYNNHITLTGIPDQVHEYMLGGRTALNWIIDRYQVKTDKKTGILNDPNTWSEDPRYILDLFKRITTVSVRTVEIVNGLPPLRIPAGESS